MTDHQRPTPPFTLPDARLLLELRDLAERVAREVGALVRSMREEAVEVAATKSSATDVVTRADLAAEARVAELLRLARPDDGLLGEEGARTAGSSGITWVVDPIDGTVNYLYGRREYAVSVAAVLGDPADVEAWRPIAGCVHAPELGTTYRAAAGLGAELDGRRLVMGEPPELAGTLLGTGFSYDAGVRAEQGDLVARLLPRIRDLRRAGAGALDLCDVAAGRLDAHLERGLNPWDVAAAELVVREAGGVVHHYPLGVDGRRVTMAARAPLDAALAEAAGLSRGV
ncbi:myo-inositol-1(or 4)-monophosphatase [Salana multivorans]|uniref:Inositol-1-monophosphatase n=1 Tax=Salana multivorans TaxID=120377 RepID=A0A3N2D1L6_9MICO|nr:inositol monophosphatase family protein [Salana multivorans]OJX94445.1 MAG: hypothetical protein BGO96_16405 [Micrococcales bacterium 73-15]ROR93672.1 myo-inositol-1(or 4)-monophosphatase [Salana multivorans]